MPRERKYGVLPRLVLVPLVLAPMLAGCKEDPPVSRDRYSDLTDCVADWGDEKLCEAQLANQVTDRAASAHGGGGAFVYVGSNYYGPTYEPGKRYVAASDGSGKTITPPATSKAAGSVTAPASTFAGKPGVASTFGKTGGFGGTGRAVASAGGHSAGAAG